MSILNTLSAVVGVSASASSVPESYTHLPNNRIAYASAIIHPITEESTAVVWFRGHDLRVEGNPSLYSACKSSRNVIALYLHDTDTVVQDLEHCASPESLSKSNSAPYSDNDTPKFLG